jgi:hypothetical protein
MPDFGGPDTAQGTDLSVKPFVLLEPPAGIEPATY